MTLEYLWIEKYKCFEKQGVNLGGEYLFRIDLSHYLTGTITIISKNNPSYIHDFYNLPAANQVANVANITAIVGENGSGKTTLFDFIKLYFPDGEGEINTCCLFITRENRGPYTVHSYNERDIKILDETGLNLKIEKRKFDTSSRVTAVGTKPFKDVNIIYFSNIFDLRSEYEVAGLNNLSTNYLVRNEKNRITEYKAHQAQFITEVQAYQNSEIDKQLRFVRYYYNKNKLLALPFKLPDKLIIERANGRTIKVIDILRSKQIYNKVYNKSMGCLVQNLEHLSDKEIRRALFSVSSIPEEYHERPLSKFINDILDQYQST
ncbi:MAG TPA: AAA family ATPase [Candidatus Cloacimonas sp.]|nr:AAA family ATPase [Candidatus Cloacimonas sp.]